MTIDVRKAKPEDAPALTAIAFAAKRHWGYPEAWIHEWRSVLTVTPEQIRDHFCFAATEDGRILGFGLLRLAGNDGFLDHLWVAPHAMCRGIGRTLFLRCEDEARQAKAKRLLIEADPHAGEFYARMGARIVGHVPAPVEDIERFLPVLEKPLN